MEKLEILNKIKNYNKTMLKLRLEEQANEYERNFDRYNAQCEAISTARECETEEITKTLKNYLSNKGVFAIGENMLDYCSLKDLIFTCNSLD